MPHIVGCGRARGIQWYQNHILWTKYTEVINANYAVYSTRTDYSRIFPWAHGRLIYIPCSKIEGKWAVDDNYY